MKIKEYVSSIRELSSHFTKVTTNKDEDGSRSQETSAAGREQASRAQANRDAVRVDSALRNEEAADPSRRARVAELKASVQDGSYNPKSKDVAKAVLKELFA